MKQVVALLVLMMVGCGKPHVPNLVYENQTTHRTIYLDPSLTTDEWVGIHLAIQNWERLTKETNHPFSYDIIEGTSSRLSANDILVTGHNDDHLHCHDEHGKTKCTLGTTRSSANGTTIELSEGNDIQSPMHIAEHEIGHALGLIHIEQLPNAMCPDDSLGCVADLNQVDLEQYRTIWSER